MKEWAYDRKPMTIPDSTPEAVLEAMERFDRELRDSPEWQAWQQNESHKYAIAHSGRQYPVKKVISLATDRPVSGFSGGDESNTFLDKLGFKIVAVEGSAQNAHSIRVILEQILAEYRRARSEGSFGGNHPIWQAFVRLKSEIENLRALREHPQLRVDWSIGKGNWARVPWLAIIDSREFDAPRRGIYGVFLFREDMTGVYLTLNQGVTKPKEELGVIEARRYLRGRANRIRLIVSDLASREFMLDDEIDLRSEGLGADYETSTIAYKLYESGHVSEDGKLIEDISVLVEAYSKTLMAEGKTPVAESKRTWIFQSNPRLFDLVKGLTELTEFTWLVKRHRDAMHIGDTVYLWEAGAEAGIVAVATIKSAPKSELEAEASKKFSKGEDKFEGEQLRVWLTIDRVLPDRITRTALLKHPQLRSLTILSAPQGTNFPVSMEEAEALKILLDGRLEIVHNFNRTSATQELIQAVESAGFVFEPWQIAAYVAAVRTKPFVILAGVTGTGKSKLPAVVARLTGGQSDLIPVRPDWTDSADVLGYVDLQGVFRPGSLLQIVRRADSSTNLHWTCIVDEMNLARVEQYFAEVLSRIEDRYQKETGGFASSPLVGAQLRSEDREWGELGLGPNVAIVGTVNMDETTHGFSRKVLDRAFTMELSDIDLQTWKSATFAPTIAHWPIAAWHPRAISLAGLSDLTSTEVDTVQKVVDVLTAVNSLLVQAQLQIGYRSRDEIALFVLHASDTASSFVTRQGMRVDPLDLAIHMKILPRLIGGSGAVRRAVLQLLGWASSGTPFSSDEQAQTVIDEWDDGGRPGSLPNSRFPRTTARLCLMWERFQAEGYTSYWL